MLSCSTWFSAPSLWMDGGLESRCVGRVYGVDGAPILAKNTLIKLPCSINLTFHIISMLCCVWHRMHLMTFCAFHAGPIPQKHIQPFFCI
jgi:hypothetical protein